jgi:hypothetical protein
MSTTGEQEVTASLGDLQGKGDHFAKLALLEKKRKVDLEDAIEHIRGEIEKFRALAKESAVGVMNIHTLAPNPSYNRADGNDVARQATLVTMKVLNVMEVKLNKLLMRKSEVINHHKQIKAEIDHFRRLRLQTDSTHKKFEAVLADAKAEIEQRLSEAAAVVEERERLLEKKDAIERINLEEQR